MAKHVRVKDGMLVLQFGADDGLVVGRTVFDDSALPPTISEDTQRQRLDDALGEALHAGAHRD